MNKKVILSLVVILAFVGYVFYQKKEKGDSDDVNVVAPSSLTDNQTATTDITAPTTTSGSTPPPEQTTASTPSTPVATNPKLKPTGLYKDGTYTGKDTDAFFGNLKIQVVVSGGKVSNVVFLDYPQDRRTSQEINQQAMPYLKAEAIKAQSANIDIVSGATQTSEAFIQSLGQILAQAKA